MKLSTIIFEKELALLTSKKRDLPEFIRSTLTQDFKEYGSSGHIHTLKEVIQWLQQKKTFAFEILNFNLEILSESVVLATYQFQTKSSLTNRSSVWILEDNIWKMKFHQGTNVPKHATSI